MKNLLVVYCADYAAIYADGKLAFQNHSVSPGDIMLLAGGPGVPFTLDVEHTESENLTDFIENTGGFPDTLEEVRA